MNIRIGNDIRMTLTVRGPKDYTRTNVKQIKCFLINECLNECSCCSDCGCKCPIERRFPREPFPQYYTPTPYTLHNCGKPMYFADPWNCKRAYSNFGGHFHDPHWWPEYRGFGITPRKFVDCCYHHHMHHSMDIFHYDPKPIDPHHCDKCEFKAGHYGHTPCGEFVYMMDATMLDGENRIQCMFPAKDQIMCGAYKLVLVITTFEQGWGCRNLHTETIDYGMVFTIVDTEDGQSGNIDIDLDQYDPMDNSNVSSIAAYSDTVPAYIFRGDSEIHIGDSDTQGNVYGFNITTKSGEVIFWDPTTWAGDEFNFYSSNEDVVEIDENGTLTIHDVQERTVVTIIVTDKNNQSVVYRFEIAIDPSSGVLPTAVVNSVSIICLTIPPGEGQYRDVINIAISVNGSNLTQNSKVILYEDGRLFDGDITLTSATSNVVSYQAQNIYAQPGHTYTYTVYSVDDPTKSATTTCSIAALPKINSASFAYMVDGVDREFTPIQGNRIQLSNDCYNNGFLVAYTGADISDFDENRYVVNVYGGLGDTIGSNLRYTIENAPLQVDEREYDQNLVTRFTFDTDHRTQTFWYSVCVDNIDSHAQINPDIKSYIITVNIDDPDPIVTDVSSIVQVWNNNGQLIDEFTLNDSSDETTIEVNESNFSNGNAIVKVYHDGVTGSYLTSAANNEYISLVERTGGRVYGTASGYGGREGDLIMQYTRSNLKGEEIYIQQRCGLDSGYRNSATIRFIDDVSPVLEDAYVDVMLHRGQTLTQESHIDYSVDKSSSDTTINKSTINIGHLESGLSVDFYHRGVFGDNITENNQRGIKIQYKIYDNNNQIVNSGTSTGYIQDQRIVSCQISGTDGVRLEATITYLADPQGIKYTYVFPLTYNYRIDDVHIRYRVVLSSDPTGTIASGTISDANNGETIWLGLPDAAQSPNEGVSLYFFDGGVDGEGFNSEDRVITVHNLIKDLNGNIVQNSTGSSNQTGYPTLTQSVNNNQFLWSQCDIKSGADGDYRTTVVFDRDSDPEND